MKKCDMKGYLVIGRTVQWDALGITSMFLWNRVLESLVKNVWIVRIFPFYFSFLFSLACSSSFNPLWIFKEPGLKLIISNEGECPLEDTSQLPSPPAQGDILEHHMSVFSNSAQGFHPRKTRMPGGGMMGSQISTCRERQTQLKWGLHARKVMLKTTKSIK